MNSRDDRVATLRREVLRHEGVVTRKRVIEVVSEFADPFAAEDHCLVLGEHAQPEQLM